MISEGRVELLNGCRFCASKTVTEFFRLPALPITGAFLRKPDEEEFLYPIRLFVCEGCGTVQTQHNISFADYYDEYSYTIGASKFADNFARILAQTVCERYGLQQGARVLEIGSGDGTQLSHFKALGMSVQGFEPSAVLSRYANQRGIPTLKELYSLETSKLIPERDRKFELILLTHVFDHLPSQQEFLQSITPIVDPQRGLLLIEVHNFEDTFNYKEYCLFQHEHTVYPTVATLQRMLRHIGLEVIDVGVIDEKVKRAHSLMVIATPRSSMHAPRTLPDIPLGPMSDPTALRRFGEDVDTVMERVRAFIRRRKALGRRLAAFGAGGRGIMTLAATAKPHDLAYICDSNPAHHGFYTPGARILIAPPSEVDRNSVDEIIVCSYGYMDEIRAQLAAHFARGGEIVSLLDILNGDAN